MDGSRVHFYSVPEALVLNHPRSLIQGVPKLFFLVLDMTPVHHVDSMGLHFLEDVVFNTRAKGIQLLVANPNRQVGFYSARHAGDDFQKARVFSVCALLDRELSYGMISRTGMCILSPNHILDRLSIPGPVSVYPSSLERRTSL
jgi:hypothetical protein